MKRILLAGFGGQGILFAGKFLAYIGLKAGREVSWLPSYGPEMRGGTANCSVILSDRQIGSPIVSTPDILVCMNKPSMDRFEEDVEAGGMLVYDSALIDREPARADIRAFAVPATTLADQNGMKQLANMVIIGKVLRESGLCDLETAGRVLEEMIPERKKALVSANKAAIELGYNV